MTEKEIFSLFIDCKKSRVYFRALKWNGKRRCPNCFYERKIYRLSSGFLRCGRCRRDFSDFTGTPFAKIKIPFNKLAYLLHAFVLGVPAFRIHREVGINVKTIERIFRVFRKAIYDNSLSELHRLKGKIEMDETMFGGYRAGRRGWGAEGKTIVFGIYKRNGEVIVFPVPNRRAETLKPLIEDHTKKGSVYYTDDYEGYACVEARGKHVTILKAKGKPVKLHINGIEGFWSYAKTWLYHYRGVPRQYFHHYLKEIEFRFNNRNKNLFRQIAKILMNFGGAI